jgi:hypothetical protein
LAKLRLSQREILRTQSQPLPSIPSISDRKSNCLNPDIRKQNQERPLSMTDPPSLINNADEPFAKILQKAMKAE